MREIPSELQTRLDAGATTLCRCWRLDRVDGASFGFTDHDAPLVFDGVAFDPAGALDASGLEAAEGLAPDNLELAGALRSDALTEDDIRAGKLDGAMIEQWLVDWTEPSLRVLLFKGSLGDIRRRGREFTAELLGLSHQLNQPAGRQFLPICDAALGDARCSVDLANPGFRAAGQVARIDAPGVYAVSGLETFDAGWFSRGALAWTSGGASGARLPIKSHRIAGAEHILELWRAPTSEIALGDSFDATAGCDKRLDTCRAKFANHLNFRGFPHMPGDDWVTSYPTSNERNDGASRYAG